MFLNNPKSVCLLHSRLEHLEKFKNTLRNKAASVGSAGASSQNP